MTLGVAQVSNAGWQLLWLGLTRAFGVVLAVILLFEQWGWKPLAAAVAAISHLGPVAALERGIAKLPPYPALVVFAVPVVLLIPLKLFALYLIAQGHTLSAAAVFIGAKIVGTGIVARLYHLTGPQLMQIGWLRRARDVVAPRLLALRDEIRASWAWRYGRLLKAEAKRMVGPTLQRLKTRLLALISGGADRA